MANPRGRQAAVEFYGMCTGYAEGGINAVGFEHADQYFAAGRHRVFSGVVVREVHIIAPRTGLALCASDDDSRAGSDSVGGSTYKIPDLRSLRDLGTDNPAIFPTDRDNGWTRGQLVVEIGPTGGRVITG